MTDYKVLLIGALLGMAMEGLRGTDFLTEKPERAEMLLDMLEEDV